MSEFAKQAAIIHVDIDPASISRNIVVDIPIVADAKAAICGDGGIQMNIQEMATAVVYELPVIICIMNNRYLGNVRQWQEMFFDRRYSSTCLRFRKSCSAACNTPSASCPPYVPDFVRLAKSYGAEGIRVAIVRGGSVAIEAVSICER